MNKFITCIFALAIGTGYAQTNRDNAKAETATNATSANITYQLIPAEGKTYGYDIMVNNKLKIHQPNIPGQAGNKGFKNKQTATKVVELVIKKMRNGEMPPTVTAAEMKMLKAI